MNSVFRTIDLLCLLIAPSIAGVVFDFLSYSWAAIFIAIWNIFSVIVEYFLLFAIYKEFPALGTKRMYSESENLEAPDEAEKEKKSFSILTLPKSIWSSIINTFKAWIIYMKHYARDAGLGLAFLYMTVLGFDNITWGYCLSQCVTESVLGGLVGVSAIFGVAGSLTFPILRKKFGLNKSGVIGTIAQVLALSLCVVSIWLEGSPFDIDYFNKISTDSDSTNEPMSTTTTTTSGLELFQSKGSLLGQVDPGTSNSECSVPSYASGAGFLSGIIAARFGLWIVDLTVTQILQEHVEEEQRGIMNGVQVKFFSLFTCP